MLCGRDENQICRLLSLHPLTVVYLILFLFLAESRVLQQSILNDFKISLNHISCGQEMKLTKNEAAALASIAKMGPEVFTVQTPQGTPGLSYNQIYRLLHGHTNSRATYVSILKQMSHSKPHYCVGSRTTLWDGDAPAVTVLLF